MAQNRDGKKFIGELITGSDGYKIPRQSQRKQAPEL